MFSLFYEQHYHHKNNEDAGAKQSIKMKETFKGDKGLFYIFQQGDLIWQSCLSVRPSVCPSVILF